MGKIHMSASGCIFDLFNRQDALARYLCCREPCPTYFAKCTDQPYINQSCVPGKAVTLVLTRDHICSMQCTSLRSWLLMPAGVLTESRGTAGDAVYTRVERLIEGGANRAGREAGSSLAPENEPPLASVQDMVRQVSCQDAQPVQP